jgi:hypothetical protein
MAMGFAPPVRVCLRGEHLNAHANIKRNFIEKWYDAVFLQEAIDIHHIFPRAWCESKGISPSRYNSIVNKTPLSSETNKIIGGNAPSRYLKKLQERFQITQERLGEILETHSIDPAHLTSDDFEGFFQSRKMELLERIEAAIGKPLMAAPVSEEVVAEDEAFDDLDEDIEEAA